ncbi:MAG: choice-of-anchor D domain-containing protein, partial [Ignavibacteria bacterium]
TSGESLVYAWYKNDILLPKDTTAILTISQTQFADSGVYHCVLTNACGTVESDPIKLSVIQPPAGPKLTLSVNTIDFGCIDKNTVKDTTLTSLIKNDGETQLTISSITINGSQKANFSILEGGGSFNLDAGATRTLKIQFKPEDKKFNTAELVITSNSTVGAETLLPLSGTSCYEEVLTSKYDFGSIENGSSGKDTVIHVINSGTKAMRIDSVTITGTSFTIIPAVTLPMTINANDTMSITVRFNNANAGTYTETLNVKSETAMYSYSLTGIVKQPSGIIELGENKGFSVYPNPADNMLSLSSTYAAQIRGMNIIDKLGTIVGTLPTSEIAPGASLQIQLNALPQGAYYLMIMERNDQTSVIPFFIIR